MALITWVNKRIFPYVIRPLVILIRLLNAHVKPYHTAVILVYLRWLFLDLKLEIEVLYIAISAPSVCNLRTYARGVPLMHHCSTVTKTKTRRNERKCFSFRYTVLHPGQLPSNSGYREEWFESFACIILALFELFSHSRNFTRLIFKYWGLFYLFMSRQ